MTRMIRLTMNSENRQGEDYRPMNTEISYEIQYRQADSTSDVWSAAGARYHTLSIAQFGLANLRQRAQPSAIAYRLVRFVSSEEVFE